MIVFWTASPELIWGDDCGARLRRRGFDGGGSAEGGGFSCLFECRKRAIMGYCRMKDHSIVFPRGIPVFDWEEAEPRYASSCEEFAFMKRARISERGRGGGGGPRSIAESFFPFVFFCLFLGRREGKGRKGKDREGNERKGKGTEGGSITVSLSIRGGIPFCSRRGMMVLLIVSS